MRIENRTMMMNFTRRMVPGVLRTIRIVAVTVVMAPVIACGDSEPGVGDASLVAGDGVTAERQLFDGQTLEGWVPRDSAIWRVEDGAISPEPGSGPGFLATTESFGDFELKADFWVDSIANGGVFLRVPPEGEISATTAIEVNVYDAHAEWPTGSVNLFQRNDAPSTIGRWNSYVITARGGRITVNLNGQTTADAQVTDRLSSGRIALQLLGDGQIRYRNISIRPLAAATP